MNAPKKDIMFTQSDAANFLQVSTKTIQNWGRSGWIPVTRLGRTVRYSKPDLLDALARLTTKALKP